MVLRGIPPVDSAVEPDLRAFLVMLSHLPVEVQMDLLRQATDQIAESLTIKVA